MIVLSVKLLLAIVIPHCCPVLLALIAAVVLSTGRSKVTLDLVQQLRLDRRRVNSSTWPRNTIYVTSCEQTKIRKSDII